MKNNNMVYIYDGSFEGLLTIIYNTLKTNIIPSNIIKEGLYKTSLFEIYEFIETDYRKSERMIKLIATKISDYSFYNVYISFLCSRKNKEMNVLNYILDGFKYGYKIDKMKSIDSVINIHGMVNYVKKESHRLKGFVRFKELESKVLYSSIGPENDVIELLSNHFKERLKHEAWIIHDEKRNKAAFYDKKEVRIINTIDLNFDNLKINNEEPNYQSLWKSFYESVTIKSRKNLRCQRNFMPKKYWKYMSEVNNE